jgi:NAD(P)-dependent dehydrogenase (short-subunit alcohol dehydrogenase family)
MADKGSWSIVNVASISALRGDGTIAYSAAKGGMIAMTVDMAYSHGRQGIRVNAVAPGPILTDNLHRAGPAMQERAGQAMPMRRIGLPEEVAATVVWLCSDQASYITGVTVPVDGGKLAGMAPFAGLSPSGGADAGESS